MSDCSLPKSDIPNLKSNTPQYFDRKNLFFNQKKLSMIKITYILLFVAAFCTTTLNAQAPFFKEDFSTGIPAATWTSTSTGTTAKFIACNLACQTDYEQYTAGIASVLSYYDDPNQGGIAGFTYRNGAATLKALRETQLDATLTSTAINCGGKNAVFLSLNTYISGGVNADLLQTSANAATNCVVRISRDSSTWTSYSLFEFNRRQYKNVFLDISSVAANQSRIFIQFRRTGVENNQIWTLDDVNLWDKLPTKNITVGVNMTGTTVSAKGVYLAHNLSGTLIPNAIKMTNAGNGLYTATMPVVQLTKVNYRFINGDTFVEGEVVPSGCGELNTANTYERTYVVGITNDTIAAVCFASCLPCGNTNPNKPVLNCTTTAGILYCENFEGLQYGKLIPQAPLWTIPTLYAATANPFVTGFANGFAHYGGTKALRIVRTPSAFDDPYLRLFNPTDGTYQLDMKLYVPKNNAAYISILNTTGFSGLTLNLTDSLRIFEGYDTQTSKDVPFGKATAYKIDDWNDVSLAVDAASKRMIVKVNNIKLYDKINSLQTGLAWVNFEATALTPLILPQTGWSLYVDDIVLRSTATLVSTASTTPVPIVTISPNPTTGFFNIQWKNADNTPPQYLRISDALGHIVFEKKGFDIGKTSQSIDLKGVANGLYFIELQNQNSRSVEKLMIQH
jgi:hypothetical protein